MRGTFSGNNIERIRIFRLLFIDALSLQLCHVVYVEEIFCRNNMSRVI